MSAVGDLVSTPDDGLPLVLGVEEAAEVLRIGRTLAYALAKRYEATGGVDGLPVTDEPDRTHCAAPARHHCCPGRQPAP